MFDPVLQAAFLYCWLLLLELRSFLKNFFDKSHQLRLCRCYFQLLVSYPNITVKSKVKEIFSHHFFQELSRFWIMYTLHFQAFKVNFCECYIYLVRLLFCWRTSTIFIENAQLLEVLGLWKWNNFQELTFVSMWKNVDCRRKLADQGGNGKVWEMISFGTREFGWRS